MNLMSILSAQFTQLIKIRLLFWRSFTRQEKNFKRKVKSWFITVRYLLPLENHNTKR